MKREVISLVHPITKRLKITIMLPRTRNGRRRPKRDVHRSDKTPTIGCINKPISHLFINIHVYHPSSSSSSYLTRVLQSIQVTSQTWSIQVTVNRVFLYRRHCYTNPFIDSFSFLVLPYAISTVPINYILLSLSIIIPVAKINETYM